MAAKPITAEELGKILHKEFERDQWGMVDPFYLKNPPRSGEDDGGMGGLHEVLERAAQKLNERFGIKG